MLNRLTDVFASLQRHNVKYVVIGGIAVVLYGVPRATFDLDMLIEATKENAEKLLQAFGEAGLATALMTTPEHVLAHEVTIFQDRVRIDVQTRTPGLSFDEAWAHRAEMKFQGQSFYITSCPGKT